MQSELTLLEQVKLGKIWDFPGGVHPPERKHLSNGSTINTLPLPQALYVPLKQHIGSAGELIVKAGQNVKKGQALTEPTTGLSLPVHAPTSGVIESIVNHVSAHPSGIAEPTLVLIPDGLEESVEAQPLNNWQQASAQTIAEHLQTMAIAGLGGATFPTYIKANSNKQIELLIINAVECEPYITSDDMLMREHADEIILGMQVLAHAAGIKHMLIGIEDNKPEAIDAMESACADIDNIEVRVVPTKYPSGGEKQLVQLLTNRQVPSGGLPADLGILVQNVGTAFAVKRAVIDGLPLTNRVVTVTGESITAPQNLWVPFGTQVKDLLAYTGITADKNQRVIMGGPMMGFNIMDGAMPVVKATNCILAPNDYYMPMRETEQACIRCGDCAAACPAELLPQQMLWFSKAQDQEKLEEYNLFDCIECGACAYVCPSQIPLVQYYRTSKAEIRQAKEDKVKAEKAKIRFEQRQERLEREKEARLKRHQEATERRRNAMAKDDSAKDKIAAALARAKAKKEGKPADTEQQAPKDKVAEAIARAKAKKEAKQTANDSQSPTDTSATPAEDKKAQVAAAIARAKAKKDAKNAENTADSTNALEPEVSPEQETKDKVAAAIARAKAKKAAKATEQSRATEETSSIVETDPEQAKKDKVAAAIARAKAKKAEKEAESSASEQAEEPTSNVDPEQAKKDKVAAAIARAKAKKAEKEAESSASEQAEEPTSNVAPEQAKKDKVAAAIARAKAKKAAKESENTEPEQANEQVSEIDPEQAKKDKVAAAIARAKAKKAAREAEQNGEQE